MVNGQLSAIARKLNEKFPNGLVFDHNAKTNKLVIRYFADQTFRIEWGGLQGNQIRYAYTQERIERWQKNTWEPLDNVSNYTVVCRLRDEHLLDDYNWLHKDVYYEAQYPTPTPMPTAMELIEWEDMIHKRAAKALPRSVRDVLDEIKKSIQGTNSRDDGVVVQVILIGSWANGSWVSTANRLLPQPSLVKAPSTTYPKGFLSLRHKVTGKTGPSDIDLLVNITGEDIDQEYILNILKKNVLIKDSGYAINLIFGKKDAQKGIEL